MFQSEKKSNESDLGDIDNDGDIDFIISGFDESDGLLSFIYTNDTSLGGTFKLTKTNNNLVAVRDGTVDFIDYDSDGDLDIIFSSNSNSLAAFNRPSRFAICDLDISTPSSSTVYLCKA